MKGSRARASQQRTHRGQGNATTATTAGVSRSSSSQRLRSRRPPLVLLVIGLLLAAALLAAAPAAFAGVEFPSTPDPYGVVTDGSVSSIAVAGDGTTYLGGTFSYIGPNTARGALLDLYSGRIVGAPLNVDGSVNASIPDGSGGYYIGGDFSAINGVECNRLAHILSDGGLDPDWQFGADGPVYALALDTADVLSEPTLFVGGDFHNLSDGNGPESREYIGALGLGSHEVTSWNPNGVAPGGTSGPVYALAVNPADGYWLFVGGDFQYMGWQWGGEPYGLQFPAQRPYLAALDTGDSKAFDWNPSPDGVVRSLAASVDGNTLYVGGDFTKVDGVTREHIAAVLGWGGGSVTGWTVGADGTVRSLVLTGGTLPWGGILYAGGDFTTIGSLPRNHLAALSNSGTTDWDPDVDGSVSALALSGDTVYAGGAFTTVGGQTRNHVAALDTTTAEATSWDPDATGDVSTLSCSSGTSVFAGGAFGMIGGWRRSNIAAVSAVGEVTAWAPNADDSVYAVAVSGDDATVYAGGQFSTIAGVPRGHIAALSAESGSATPWDPGANDFVSCLAPAGSTVYAGGGFTSIGDADRSFIAALDTSGDATGWDPSANNGVSALAVSGSSVYAGGAFTRIGGEDRGYIAALDATSGLATAWNPNADGAIGALALSGSSVYAAGLFTAIGGDTRHHIAALDAATGDAIGADPNADNYAFAIAVSGSTIYAGGDFTALGAGAGQVTRKRLGAVDAATGAPAAWNPDADASVFDLAFSPDGTSLFAGGSFISVGGVPHRSFAVFHGTTTYTITPSVVGGASSHGTISPDTPQTVDAGATPEFTFAPDDGYRVKQVKVDGAAVTPTTATTYKFPAVTADHTISVEFSPVPGDSPIPSTPDAATCQTDGPVRAVLTAADGKVYIGGEFTSVGGTARQNVARLLANGSLDTSWQPYTDNTVHSLALSPDGGTLYLGGDFTNINDEGRPNLGAVSTADGTVTDWNPNRDYPPGRGPIYAILPLDTTVYVGGAFTELGSPGVGLFTQRNNLAAINAENGEVLPWDPDADAAVRTLAASSDGTYIYAGGSFVHVGGSERPNGVTLWADGGGVVSSWNADLPVFALAPSGATVFAGGLFHVIGGYARQHIAQIDGGVATAWAPDVNDEVDALAVSGGLVYAGGYFSQVGGSDRDRLAAIDATTMVENAWDPSADQEVYALAASADGKSIYAGGAFTTIGGAPRRYFAAFRQTTTYTITPSVDGGNGTISPDTPQTVDAGATPTFTFAPADGYVVGRVLVDGAEVTPTSATTYKFPAVDKDHTISVEFAPAAHATHTWTGAGADDNWSTNANWQEGLPPSGGDSLVVGDSVVFPAHAGPETSNNDLTGLSLAAVTIADGGYTITGNRLTITSGLTRAGGAGSSTWSVETNLYLMDMGQQIEFDVQDPLLFSAALTSGAGHLVKTGDGTLTLGGGVTFYEGWIKVSAGVLAGGDADQAINCPAPVLVESGGTVAGLFSYLWADLYGTLAPGGPDQIVTLPMLGQTWEPGGKLTIKMDAAEGQAGVSPGWDIVNSIIGAGLLVSATEAEPFTVQLVSMGDVADFDPSQAYSWPVATGNGLIENFDPAKFTVDTTSFTPTQAATGSFSVSSHDGAIYVDYAPPLPAPDSNFANALAFGQGYLLAPLSDAIAFSGSSDFTMEMWVRPSGMVTEGSATLARQRGSWGETLQSWLFLTPGNHLRWGFDKYGVGWYWPAETVQQLPGDHWSHVAWVKQGTDVTLYIDGQLVQSDSIAGAPAETATACDGDLTFGGDVADESGNPLAGDLDEVMVYDRALTADDIAAVYNRGRGQSLALDPATAPVRYYQLDESSGTSAADSGSDGVAAILTEMAASPWIESTAGLDVYSAGGGPASVGLAYGDDATTGLTVTIASQPDNGTIDLSSPATGQGTYTPDPGWTGFEDFTYTVSDGTTTSPPQTATVTSDGVTITYTGPVGGDWSVPGNWDLARVPQNGDNVVAYASVDDIASLWLGDVTVVSSPVGSGDVTSEGGAAVILYGTLRIAGLDCGWNVDTTLGPAAVVRADSSGSVTARLSGGNVSGPVPFGGGHLTLAVPGGGSNNYVGGTRIMGGVVEMQDGALPAGSAVSISSGATCVLNNSASGGGRDYDNVINGPAGATLGIDRGRVVLGSDSSAFAGTVRISSALTVTNALGGTIVGGGILNGPGVVGRIGAADGSGVPWVWPSGGVTAGTLTGSGYTAGAMGGLWITMTDAGGEAGSGWDQVIVGDGGADFTALSVESFFLMPFTYTSAGDAGPCKDFDPTKSYRWTVMTVSGTVSGFDAGKFMVEPSSFANDTAGGSFSVETAEAPGGAGTLVQLVFTPKLTPGTLTWSGEGTDAKWSTAANWDADRAPIDGDSLVFPAHGKVEAPDNDLTGLSLVDVTIDDGGYGIIGNAVTLTGTMAKTASLGTSSWHPDITLTDSTCFQVAEGHLNMHGVLSGEAGFNLLPTASQGWFGLSSVATYTGTTEVAGWLQLRVDECLPSGPGYGDLHISTGGVIDLYFCNQSVNGLTGEGLIANIDESSSDNVLTVGRADTSSQFDGYIGFTLSSSPADYLTVKKVGTGTFTLANNHNGWLKDTIVAEGTFQLGADGALPFSSDTGRLLVGPDATFDLNGHPQTVAALGDYDSLHGGTVTSSGAATLTLSDVSGSFTPSSFGGTITDAGTGPGTLALVLDAAGSDFSLFGTNTYRGGTTVKAGWLRAGSAGALPAGGDLVVGVGGPGASGFDLRGQSITVGLLSGDGTIDNQGADALLTVGTAADSEFSGPIMNSDGLLALTKVGEGTLVLSGANSYLGDTTVSEGKLLVPGQIAAGGAATVAAGALLGGKGDGTTTGMVHASVDLFGTIAPGAGIGSLHTGPETWEPGGTYAVQMDAAEGASGASPGWDALAMHGALTLAATTETTFTVRLLSDGPVADFDPAKSYSWQVATTGDGVSGFDPAKFTVDTSDFTPTQAPDGTFSVSTSDGALFLEYTPSTGTLTFTNPAGGNWSVGQNWDLGRAPHDGDSLVLWTSTDDLPGLQVQDVTLHNNGTGVPAIVDALADTMLTVDGELFLDGTSHYWNVPTVVSAETTVSTSGIARVNAAIGGGVADGTLTLAAAPTAEGELTLSGSNSYAGTTYVAEGSVVFEGPALPAGSPLAIEDGATAELVDNASVRTYDNLFAGSAATTLTVGGRGQTLSADNSTFAGTVETGGVVVVAGSLGGSIRGGGILGGTGVVADVAPDAQGSAPGAWPSLRDAADIYGSGDNHFTVSTLTAASWTLGSAYAILGCGITDAAGDPGSGYDRLRVTGALDLSAATADTIVLLPVSLSGGAIGPCTGFDPTQPYRWESVRIDGAVTGFSPAKFMMQPGYFKNDLAGGTFSVELTEHSSYKLAFTGARATPSTYRTLDIVFTPATLLHTWTGLGADAKWSSAANWDAGVPESGDALLFPAGAAQPANVNDLSGLELASVAVEAGGYELAGEAVTLTGALESTGTSLWAIATALPAAGSIASAEGTLTVTAALSGGDAGGSFTKSGPGELVLAAGSSYAGGTLVAAGTLTLAAAGALPDDSATEVASGAALVFDVPAAESYDNLFSGAGTLRVTPGGTVTLSGDSSAFGGALETAGALVVTGALPAPVTGSGVVGGAGSVGALAVGTLVAWPGLTEEAGPASHAAPARFTAADLSCLPRARFAVTIADPEGTAGSGFDELRATEPVDLTGAALQVAPQTVTAAGLLGPTGLFEAGEPYRWAFLRAPAISGFEAASAKVATAAFADPVAGRFTVERTAHEGYDTLDLVYAPVVAFDGAPIVGSGAARLPADSLQRITWHMAAAVSSGSFDVLLVSAAGKVTTLASALPTDGTAAYGWDWAAGAPASGLTVKVVYHGPGGDAVSAASGVFALTPPTPTLTAPAGGSLRRSQETSVTWTMDVPVSSGSFKLYLQKQGSTSVSLISGVTPIAAVPGRSAYSWDWKVTQAVGTYTAWVYYYSAAGKLVSKAAGSGTFELLPPPTPTLTAPVSGSLRKTSETTVTWTMDVPVSSGSFKLYLQKQGSTTVSLISGATPIAAVPGQSAYAWSWRITQAAGTYTAWVYYYDAAGALVSKAAGSGPFQVLEPPTPTVTAPLSGSFKRNSAETTVTWTMDAAPNAGGSFKVYLQKAGTTTMSLISGTTPLPADAARTDYLWRWRVTQLAGTYTVWVYYYAAGTTLASKAGAATTITITP